MTREELIEMLNILLDNAEIGGADITVIKHVSFDSFKFVLVQTIKALEQEPTDDATLKDIFCMGCEYKEQEPCDDAISRSDMLDAIGHGTTYTSEDLQGIIKGLPSVNPQPCDDAISRQAVLEGLASIAKAKARSDAQKALMGRVMFFTEHLSSVNPQEPCIQEKQANADKIDAVYIDGFKAGYSQARFDLEQEPKPGHWIETIGENGITSAVRCSECGCPFKNKCDKAESEDKKCI